MWFGAKRPLLQRGAIVGAAFGPRIESGANWAREPHLHIDTLLRYFAAMTHQRYLRSGRISDAGRVYAITKCTANRQLVLCTPHPAPSEAADIIFDALQFSCRNQWMAVVACVVMPDHMHLLLQLGRAKTLSVLLHDLFGFTAWNINQALGRRGALWQAGYFDHAIRRSEDMNTQANYIVENPVRAGFVSDWQQWPHAVLYPDWGGWPLPDP